MKYGSASTTVTDRKLDVYVDADNGSDEAPGTLIAPVRTILEAEKRIPSEVLHTVVVHVRAASVPYDLPTFRPRAYGALVIVVCDWGGQRGDGFVTHHEDVSTSASSQTQIVCAGGLGVNTHRGRTVVVESGEAAGDRRLIADHSDTTISPTHAFSAPIVEGDTFRIVDSGAILQPSADTQIHGGPINPSGYVSSRSQSEFALVFANFKCADDVIDQLYVTGHVVQYGWEWVNNVGPAFDVFGDGSLVRAGQDSATEVDGDELASIPVDHLGAPTHNSWAGWGWSHRTGFSFLQGDGGRYGLAGVVMDRFPMNSGRVFVAGYLFWNLGCRLISLSINRLCSLVLSHSEVEDVKIGGRITGAVWGISAEGPGARIHLLDVDATLSVPGGEAVRSEHGASIYVQNGDVTDCDIGLLARAGGTVWFRDGVTVVADTAQTRTEDPEGAPSDRPIGDYDAVGRYISAADGSVVQRFS